MRKILLFGAGKSSAALISYLLENAAKENWQLTIADANLETIQQKIGTASSGHAVALDVTNEVARQALVKEADVVISLLPPSLHILVASDCLTEKKHLLTASYVSDEIGAMKEDIAAAGILFLCEMGLDPGIDHMSAKKLLDSIHGEGGKVVSFLSHCGGLVAPESVDNPWHYKISWNPRNVVMAGKGGAVFKQDGYIKELAYEALFAEKRFVSIPNYGLLCWYPNRDSLSYIPLYGLEDSETFIRTTLRHPDFIYGWKNLLELKLTDETPSYNTDGKSLQQFYKEHLEKQGFGDWLQNKLYEQFDNSKSLLAGLTELLQLEKEVVEKGLDPVDELMMVDNKGDLQEIDIDQLKMTAASALADRMHDANLTLKQLFFLGMDDEETIINRGTCSAAEVLQFALEKKLMLQPQDKDMVVMLHEVEYTRSGERYKTTSLLVQTGDDALHTAMAKTVGLPLGIAARLILNGEITNTGLCIPTLPDIYQPVLKELENFGISFVEKTEKLT